MIFKTFDDLIIFINMKQCNKCELDKPICEFRKNKTKRDGYHDICKLCEKEYQKQYREANKEKAKQYRETNKEKAKQYQKQYLLENKQKNKERNKEYYNKNKLKSIEKTVIWFKTNPERLKIYRKKHYIKHSDKIKIYQKEYSKKRRTTDTLFKLKANIRSLLSNSLKTKNIGKKTKTTQILGCTFLVFKQYLESKFKPWMNWDNYGKYNGELNHGWDIDHRIPISSAKTEEDVISLSHYTNLQPLCSYINRCVKSGNYNK